MSKSPSKEELLALWLEGKISEAEMVDSFGKKEWEDYKKILETTATFSISETNSRAEAWTRLSARMSEEETPIVSLNTNKSRRIFISTAIAAAITLIFAVLLFRPSSTTVFKTGSGEKLTFYLPDSSSVILNAESSVSFESRNWENNRVVNLSGEAFFAVEKGNQFSVKTSRTIVEVLGTQFNVFNRESKDQITCYHGKVSVSSISDQNHDQSRILTQGMTAETSTSGSVEVTTSVIKKTPEWAEGRFSFNQEPFENVIAEVERQYGVTIEYPEMNTTYTGAFFDNDLKNALLLVCEPMGLNYKIENETLIILTHSP